jgi:hypothetical protein
MRAVAAWDDYTDLGVINHLLSMRRARMLSADTHLIPVLWVVVLAGAIITMALSWCIHVTDKRLHVLLSGTYSLVVGLMVFCVFTLDHPFWGKRLAERSHAVAVEIGALSSKKCHRR